jgi:hypothetical protein
MKLNRITLESALYALALAIAAGLRFSPLGRTALNDVEAGLALQSYEILRGGLITLVPHPLYILGTAALDFIFGASTFLARFLPAVAGILLVGLPYLYRRQLGRRVALILAFLVALDPGLIGSSVQAGSSLFGPVCILLALAGWAQRRPIMAGICAGLALLGGPGIWPGLAGLAVAMAVTVNKVEFSDAKEPFLWRKAGLAALASLGLAGTLLMFVPTGINAAAASLPEYLAGWGRVGGTPVLLLVGALFAYEVFALVLGAGGAARCLIRDRRGMDLFLAVWWVAALVLALVYPSRQVMDLVWVILPLLALAARQIDRMLLVRSSDRLATGGQAALILLLLLLLVNLTISWPAAESSSANQLYRWTVLGLALLLLVAESLLVGWGWSAKIAASGLLWGFSGLLALYTVSAGFNAAGLSGRGAAELWRSGPAFAGEKLFFATVKEYTLWTPELNQVPQIVVSGLPSPAVKWALRDFAGLSVADVISTEAKPDILVTADKGDIAQAAAYTGQDFALTSSPAWDLITPAEWVNWLIYRRVQAEVWRTTNLILWIRADRFPGAAGQPIQP